VRDSVVDPDLGDDFALLHLVAAELDHLVQVRFIERGDEVG
jgi:hypothetical protein